MKSKNILSVLLLLICFFENARATYAIGIDSCIAMGLRNYPLTRQSNLIRASLSYTLSNLSKGIFPQININGFASYQSDVTGLNLNMPGIKVPEISRDQYRLFAEVLQPISDILINDVQKQQAGIQTEAEALGIETELYALRERIIQLYFGILLLEKQLEQQHLINKDLGVQTDWLRKRWQNGTATEQQLWQMEAESIKAVQKHTELRSVLFSYRNMLYAFLHIREGDTLELKMPESNTLALPTSRPETRLFDTQGNLLDMQLRLLKIKNLPRFSLFLQSGLGRPALNMLSNDFNAYYIGGIRLSWNLSGWYTYRKDCALIGMQKDMLDVRRKTFLFNNQQKDFQLQAEQEKYHALIKSDEALLALRKKIRIQTEQQVREGTATAGDLILSMNAEEQASTALLQHRIQLLLQAYSQQNNKVN